VSNKLLNTSVALLCAYDCVYRCFHDRLINSEDKRWFTEKMIDLISRHFSLRWSHEDVFERSDSGIVFGDFLRPGGDKIYEQVMIVIVIVIVIVLTS